MGRSCRRMRSTSRRGRVAVVSRARCRRTASPRSRANRANVVDVRSMGSRRKRAAPDATVTADALLRAEPAAVGRLAASELVTWKRVMDIVRAGQTACPAVLVHALVAFD